MSAIQKIINEKYKTMREKVLSLKPEIDAHKDGEELPEILKEGLSEIEIMLRELQSLVDTYLRSLTR